MSIDIFTDGSTFDNQSKNLRVGGVGVFFGNDDKRNISHPLIEKENFKVTNQVAELTAVVMALHKLSESTIIKDKKINIYTDSMYIVNSFNIWMKNWIKNDWKKSNNKPVDNLKLMKKVYYLGNNLNINFIHIRAHKNPPPKDTPEYYFWYGNNQADKLAVEGSKIAQNIKNIKL
jgi:ribonuclease HI